MAKKRRSIGLQLPDLRTRYCQALLREAQECAVETDVNLWVLVGGPYGVLARQEAATGVIYEFANSRNFDGLVVAAGALFGLKEVESFHRRELPFRRLPAVGIGGTLPQTPCVMPDNYASYRALVEHLIDVHGYSDIAFLSGPPASTEGRARLEGWRDALLGRGMDAPDSLLWQGDFVQSSGRDVVRRMQAAGRLPRALACANDGMAIGVLQECTRLGIRVPADVAVVGFDNAPESRFDQHNLTTVSPRYGALVATACERLYALLEGAAVAETTSYTPADVVIRGSCGCLGLQPSDGTEGDAGSDAGLKLFSDLEAHFVGCYVARHLDISWATDFTNDFRDVVARHRALQPHFWLALVRRLESVFMRRHASGSGAEGAVALTTVFQQLAAIPFQSAMVAQATESVVREDQLLRLNELMQVFSSASSLHDLSRVLADELPHFGIRDCQMYLYSQPFVFEPGDTPWSVPSGTSMVMNYRNGQLMPTTGTVVDPKLLVDPRATWDDARHSVLVLPMAHGSSQLGYVLFGLENENYFVHDALRVHLASAANAVSMVEELQALSRQDELTGLLNRRGFMELATQNYAVSLRNRVPGVVVYMDLDQVKQINDAYGHQAGDEALRAAASALRTCLRETDIYGRIGGDEFAAMIQGAGEGEAALALSRLSAEVDSFNLKSGRPWHLGLSIGYKAYEAADGLTFAQVLAAADAELYEAKRSRRMERSL